MDTEEGAATDALRAAYEAEYAGLVRLSFLLADDPSIVEDIVQDVFIRSADHLGTLAESERRAYLRTAVVNAWRNERRHRRVQRRWAGIGRDEGSAVGDVEAREDLWAEVSRLPPRQRACVVLRYYEDLPEAEIAGVLGCRVGTVKSQLSRALAKLRVMQLP